MFTQEEKNQIIQELYDESSRLHKPHRWNMDFSAEAIYVDGQVFPSLEAYRVWKESHGSANV